MSAVVRGVQAEFVDPGDQSNIALLGPQPPEPFRAKRQQPLCVGIQGVFPLPDRQRRHLCKPRRRHRLHLQEFINHCEQGAS